MLKKLKELFREGGASQEIPSVIVSLIRDITTSKNKEVERDVVHYTVVTGINEVNIDICNSQETQKIEIGKDGELTYDDEKVSIGSLFVMLYE